MKMFLTLKAKKDAFKKINSSLWTAAFKDPAAPVS